MKTILVATDFSAPANNAVSYAAHLAQNSGAELILFNVFKLSIHASNSLASSSNVEQMIARDEEQLRTLAQEIEENSKITVRWVLEKDNTIEKLKEYTKNNPVDLVVMGIESNLTEYKWLGNTTTAAIKLMQFPLLVVPNDIQFEGINKVLYACKASYLKDGREMDVLKQFVHVFNAELEVFHVLTTRDVEKEKAELEQVMDEMLEGVDHIYRYVENHSIIDGIKEGLEQFPANLLVMIPRKLGFFESLIKGSSTSQMTVRTRVPLLVIPKGLSVGSMED